MQYVSGFWYPSHWPIPDGYEIVILYPYFRIGCVFLTAAVKPTEQELPYPWCVQPEACKGKGYCPRDPNCGE